jgi:hypothetical protein
MTVDEITGIDKELIAARYEAAITETSTPAGSLAGIYGPPFRDW